MSNAWEVTNEDVQEVLRKHGLVDEKLDTSILDFGEIEAAVLHYTSFENQCIAAMIEIEAQLMDFGIIPQGPGKFEIEDEYEIAELFDED